MPQARPERTILSNSACLLLIGALPFLLFYWMIPFFSNLTLGTDYVHYHVAYRLALMFSIKTGSFPLYAPFCYYGQSSTLLHAAQLYHPVAYIAAWLPGYWSGYSLEWVTLIGLILLALSHFFLFRLLQKLNLSAVMAFLISMAAVYNLNTVYHFWNSMSLGAVSGLFFTCAALGCYYLDPARKLLPVWVIVSLYWLITSGFAPIVYFGVIGTILFALLFPFLHAAITDTPVNTKRIRTFWVKTGFLYIAGGLLSAAYLFPFFFDYLQNSAERGGQPYEWSNQLCDSFAGFINNFFYPLGSSVFGAFGGSPLFLMAVIAPFVLRLFRVKVPGVIWTITIVAVGLFLYMQGERTPVHYWTWKYFPLMSSVRGPGRISIILPVLFLMLLAWLVQHPPFRITVSGKTRRLVPLSAAALSALLLFCVYMILPDSWLANDHYSCPCNIRNIPSWIKPVVLSAGASLLMMLAIWPLGGKHRWIKPATLLLAVLQLTVLFRYGPPAIADKEKMPTFEDILAENQESIRFQPFYFLNQHAGSATVVEQLKQYFMEPDLASIYRKHLPASSIEDAYRILNTGRKQDEVVVQNYSPDGTQPVVMDGRGAMADQVTLAYSAYNRLVFDATARGPAFFVLAYPYSGHWKAWVNGKRAAIFRANGAAQAVRIPGGKSTIEFRYWSNAAFTGMLISCVTLISTGIFFGLRRMRKTPGYGVAAGAAVVGVGIFLVWFYSLYTGQNIQTRHTWEPLSSDRLQNLAFGKQTQMSSHRHGYPYLYSSRHAVDGGRHAASCFFTDRQDSPWWQVDLGRVQPVGSIVLYASRFTGDAFNKPPLTLSVSQDGRHWKKTEIGTLRMEDATPIVFEQPELLRYVNIKASGECMLTLNEVEVYPPDSQ